MFRETYISACIALCEDLDTAVSRQVASLLRDGRHVEYLNLEVEWSRYNRNDLHVFRNDYLCLELLSKFRGLDTKIDTKAVAVRSFTAAEQQCFETNSRLTDSSCPEWARWLPVISRAQRKIESCLGTRPKFSKLLDRFKWGKGATYSLKGEYVRSDYKLCEEQISVTPKALPYLRAAMATDYAWLRARGLVADGPVSLLANTFKGRRKGDFQLVRGSRGITVPKNAKTDRFIAAEPSGNIFLQLGVGDYFRQCLHRVGINLDDQRENQDLARIAVDHGLATVDLKAASDTIAWELVWLLLPLEWSKFLSDLRSPEMLIGGNWISLEKFSSMGNGFTFELESLIFWALTASLSEHLGLRSSITSVYGDDIICPVEVVPDLVELFTFCGFTTNQKKTHFSGLFRESCGKHYFGGKDVTPVYQKETFELGESSSRDGVPEDLCPAYRARNRLFYHALDRGAMAPDGTALLDSAFRRAVKLLDREIKSYTTVDLVPIVPTFLHRNFLSLQGRFKGWSSLPHLDYDVASSPVFDIGLASDSRSLVRGGYRGNAFRFKGWEDAWVYKGLRFKPKKFLGIDDALLAISLRAPASGPFNGSVTRRSVGSYVKHQYTFRKPGELRWI